MVDFKDRVLSQIPAPRPQAIACEAERDADRVGAFLQAYGFSVGPPPVGKSPVCLPMAFLTGLGAALRLLAWEHNGTRAHLPVDLPSAMEAIQRVFVAAVDPHAAKSLGTMAS